jgi:hypothetical protein
MDEKDRSKSDQDLQAERDKIAAELRSVPKDDPRHKQLETRYNEVHKEQTNRAAKAGQTLNKDEKESFKPGQEPELRYFPQGTKFEKHADSDAVAQNRPMSQYWNSSESITMKDGRNAAGMKEVAERHDHDPAAMQHHARFRSAVSYNWNTKADQRVEMELQEGRYGYVGPAKNQTYDKDKKVTMIGGDDQTVLPKLKEDEEAARRGERPSPYNLETKGGKVAGSIEEQRTQNEAMAAQRGKGPPPRDPSPSAGGGPPPRTASNDNGPPSRGGNAPSSPSAPDKGRSR